ncbi:MAG: carbohydrate kinase family protein [Planctomycetota bacterium]
MAYTVVGLGEILWDLFGEEKHLGGAPANFAYHVHALGDRGIPVSRIGADTLGRELLDRLARLGVPTEFIQIDPSHPTGTVVIRLDDVGQPDFTVTPDVAWDYLELTDELEELAEQADAICFGTLAQRSPTTRRTVRQLIGAERRALIVCDLNLRSELIDLGPDDPAGGDMVAHSLGLADVLKLNEEEFDTLAGALRRQERGEPLARWLMGEFDLHLVCVTRGARGCVLYGPDGRTEEPGIEVDVADTVGAGDAFTAALVHGLLAGRPMAEVAAFANRLGAYVASRPGATPPVDRSRLPR